MPRKKAVFLFFLSNFKYLALNPFAVFLVGMVSIFWTAVGLSNVTSSSNQNFNPTNSSHDYVTVYSAETLKKGEINFGLFSDLAANTLPYFDENDSGVDSSQRRGVNDLLLSAHGGLVYGLHKKLSLGMSLRGIAWQDVKDKETPHGEFSRQGLSQFDAFLKWQFHKRELTGLALLMNFDQSLIEKNPYSGGMTSKYLSLGFITDLYLGFMEISGNLSYRTNVGQKDEIDDRLEAHENDVLASAAAKIPVPGSTTEVLTEAYTLSPLKSLNDESLRHTSRLEFLVGARTFYSETTTIQYGVTTEGRHSVSSPDWRLYAGWVREITPSQPSSEDIILEPVDGDESSPLDASEEDPDELLVLRELNFKLDSAEFINAEESLKYLATFANRINSGKPLRKLIIEGHTCALGTETYNRSLSSRRSEKIKSLLVNEHGLDVSVISATGLGEAYPVSSNADEEGRELNRRVAFKLYFVDGE